MCPELEVLEYELGESARKVAAGDTGLTENSKRKCVRVCVCVCVCVCEREREREREREIERARERDATGTTWSRVWGLGFGGDW